MQWGKFVARVVRKSDKQSGDFLTSNSKLECALWKAGAEAALKMAGVEKEYTVEVVEPEIIKMLNAELQRPS
jgi:hypothetical protein